MPISAEAGVMPALARASFTVSRDSGGVTMYHAEPSSFISSAPASKTRSSNFSSEAASFGMVISPLRWNIQPTAPVAFEHGFFVLFAFELAGAAENGALDVFIRHVLVLARENGRAQPGVGVRITAADASRDGNFSDDPSENAAALGVGGRFLVFDCCPF